MCFVFQTTFENYSNWKQQIMARKEKTKVKKVDREGSEGEHAEKIANSSEGVLESKSEREVS